MCFVINKIDTIHVKSFAVFVVYDNCERNGCYLIADLQGHALDNKIFHFFSI